MPAANQPEIIRFTRDMTLRWPCRQGDFILWMGYSDIFSGESVQIHDLWEMRDGYHVTITNRPEDFPVWFELHPTEVRDILALKMEARIKEGHYPLNPWTAPTFGVSNRATVWPGWARSVPSGLPWTESSPLWIAGNASWPWAMEISAAWRSSLASVPPRHPS
jgi:hypothetical protein